VAQYTRIMSPVIIRVLSI